MARYCPECKSATSPKESNEIHDLIKIAEVDGANIPMLLFTAWSRGFVDGKNMAKKKAIEAIQQEK